MTTTGGPWRREGDNLVCEHGTFELPITCAICAESARLPDDEPDEPLPPPPEGCLSTSDHERQLVTLVAELEEMARGLCNARGKSRRIKLATAARLFEVAIKARRAANEQASIRERRAYVLQREKRIRDRMRRPSN